MSPPTTLVQLRVRPRHCDAQGMVHASRYYDYFEEAFIAWLDDHAGGYAALRSTGVDLVIVDGGCSYRHPARLDDQLTLEARPVSAGLTSFTMFFLVQRDGEGLAVGRTTYVSVAGGERVGLPGPLVATLDGLPTRGRGIDRTMALDLLSRLHSAQGAFYSGGDSAALRAVLDQGVIWHVRARTLSRVTTSVSTRPWNT